MSSHRWMSLMRHVYLLGFAGLLATGSAGAQTTASANQFSLSNSGESSSLPPAPAFDALAASRPQDRNEGARPDAYQGHGLMHHLTFEAGGGGNAPTNESSPYITWGGNFTFGVGANFTRMIALMAEYQFIDDKLPGAIIAETGANGGNAHIWSLTLDPVIDLFPKSENTIYVTGGGGFYRKVTSFTDPQQALYCDYYFCGVVIVNQVVGHFSSNQSGWSAGAGFEHKMGGMYGDSLLKLFAEARYLDVDTPAVSASPNGLGPATIGAHTRLIPVTFGVRF